MIIPKKEVKKKRHDKMKVVEGEDEGLWTHGASYATEESY